VPRLVTSAVVDAGRVEEILAPRTGIVDERLAEDGSYEATYGPVEAYRREVDVTALADGTSEVTQTVEYRLTIPFFGWLFAWPYRNVLGRLGTPPRHPWWAPPDPLDARAAIALATLAALTAVAVYPGVLLTQTIEFAREEMGFAPSSQSLALAVVRGDVLIALVVVWLADRRGRRQMTLTALVGGCTFTALGALSPNLAVLTGTQFVARGLLTACGVLVGIMAAEEMPSGSRAYAVSILAVSGALGAAVALAAFPLADLDVRGWRVLFAMAVFGIPLALRIGRTLPESRRFRAPHREVSMSGHGRRFWLLAASAFLFAIFVGPSAHYQNVFLRRELEFSAARISLFTVVTNVWGGIGIVAGGQLADVRGRRFVAAIAITGGVGATVLMFFSSGWTVWAWSTVAAIVGAATVPALGVYGPELFPTSLRGRANGIISGVGRLGSVLGLLVLAKVVDRTTQLAPIMALLALGPALVVVLVLTLYPETAHRELEELNPEDDLRRQ